MEYGRSVKCCVCVCVCFLLLILTNYKRQQSETIDVLSSDFVLYVHCRSALLETVRSSLALMFVVSTDPT